MSNTNVTDPSADIQNSTVSRVQTFLKSTFFGYSNPILEEKKRLKELQIKLKTDPKAQYYLSKKLTFSKEFLTAIVAIHKYTESFRKNISFESLFDIKQFPLFILNYYSTSKQQEQYQYLVEPEKIKNTISKYGLSKTRAHIRDVFHEYKNSFSTEQIYNVHKILDLGVGLFTLIQYNFSDLILMLYPMYPQDKKLENLNKNYKPIALEYITTELEIFISHLSSIKSNFDYYEFMHLYGVFEKIKIISKKEFDGFFHHINNFVADNMLLSILQVEEQSTFITPIKPSTLPKNNNHSIVNIVTHISKNAKQQHHQAISLFIKESEYMTFNYMFDKQTIQQIKFQQNKFDMYLNKDIGNKSSLSISVVLLAFSEKIFFRSIRPTLEFIVNNTVFLLPEFKKDFIYYQDLIELNFQHLKKNLKEARNYCDQMQNITSVEIKAKQYCKDFLYYVENFNKLLNIIYTAGNEELENKVQLIIPKDKMEKLLKNIAISKELIQKIYYYVQIYFQIADTL